MVHPFHRYLLMVGSELAKVDCEEIQHHLADFRGRELWPAMPRTCYREQRNLDPGAGKRLMQQFALMVRHRQVPITVQNQKRWIVRSDVADRVGDPNSFWAALDRTTDQTGRGRVGGILHPRAFGQRMRVHLE